MKKNQPFIQRHVTLSLIFLAALISFIGGYIYLDSKADYRAQEVLTALAEQAKSIGSEFHYQSVDTSLLSRSVTLSHVYIKGSEQEPDISLEQVKVKGLGWQTLLGKNSDHIPLNLAIIINEGEIYLKPGLITSDRNIQALAEHLGNHLRFSLSLNYHYGDKGVLTLNVSNIFEDNFHFNSQFVFGNMQWLTMFNQKQPYALSSEIIKSTLKQLRITFNNDGIIEKIRAVAAKRTGMTPAQLIQNSVSTMQELKVDAEKFWGPLFLPMIDELIKFTQKPERLTLSVHPTPPIDSDMLILATQGGNAGMLELIKKSNLTLLAN